MDKKAALKTITKAILAIAMLLILLFIFRDKISGQSETIDDKMCEMEGDKDNDGVPDMVDDCLCKDESKCDDPEKKRECREKYYGDCS